MIRITAFVALAWALGAALPAIADGSTQANGITVDAQGKLVSIDETRRAQLVAQLRASMVAAGTPATSGPVRALADGTQTMRLGAEHTAFVVARTNTDDTLDVQCVLGVEAAAQLLATSDTQ